MASVLDKLGLTAEEDEHEANVKVLKSLGLKPEDDDHPATAPKGAYQTSSGSMVPVPEQQAALPGAPAKTMLGRIHAAIDPSTVIPAAASDIGGNIVESARSGLGMVTQGASDITSNQPATGVGRVGMGALGTVLSPLTGAVRSGENALADITGNPDFAKRASLMVPFPVGKTAGAVAHAVAPSTRAIDMVAERMTPEQLARMQTNPRLRPMDVSKGVRDLAVGTAKDTSQPKAMASVVTSMEHSAATAKDAVRGTYNEAMGPPPNLYDQYMKLQNQAQEIGKTKIQPVLDIAKPVDTSSVIADMDKIIKPGVQAVVPGESKFQSRLQAELQEWKAELTDASGSMLTDPHKLHDVQSDMRRRAEELSMHPETRRLGRQLYEFREKLKNNIEASAPGYKAGLGKYKDQVDIEEAYKFGRDVLKNTDDLKTDPSYLAQWVKHKDRTPEELEAARLGARQAIEGKMGRIKSSGLDPGRSGTDVPQIDFNRQKLEHLFGKEQTEQMFKHLQDERDIAVTNSRGLSNSTTAEAQAAQAMLKPRDIAQPHSQLPAWALATGAGVGALVNPTVGAAVGGGLLGLRAAKSGYDWLGRQHDLSRNTSLAQLITRNDPETISKIAAAMDRLNRRNKLSHLLAPP